MFPVAAGLLSTLLLLPASEQAQLRDGQRVSGALGLDGRGQLRFAIERSDPVNADQIALIRFPATELPPFRVPGGLRLVLRDGQTLTGPLIRLDGDSVVLRTAWADQLKLARGAVASLTQLSGWQPIFEDDFSAGLKSWTVKGTPEVQQEPARVLLNRSGQELVWSWSPGFSRSSNPGTPTPDLEAGRVGINFQEGPAGQGRCLAEFHFQEGKQEQVLRVVLTGPGDRYTAETAGLAGTAQTIERTPGWHRLTVQFGRRSLRVLIDDLALWYNLERGPGGPLRRVRLVREGGEDKGGLTLASFTVSRSVEAAVRPPGEPTQDEVWLATGDQLFGRLVQADARSLTIQGKYGKRILPWTAVRGLYPQLQAGQAPVRAETGVRLWLNNGLTPEPDLLEGELLGLDGERLKLRHAFLGELSLERRWLKQLQPLPR